MIASHPFSTRHIDFTFTKMTFEETVTSGTNLYANLDSGKFDKEIYTQPLQQIASNVLQNKHLISSLKAKERNFFRNNIKLLENISNGINLEDKKSKTVIHKLCIIARQLHDTHHAKKAKESHTTERTRKKKKKSANLQTDANVGES